MKERRYFPARELRMNTNAAGKPVLTGLAIPYGQLSENLGGLASPWYERVRPGAARRALREQQDIRHLENHDPHYILGRTSAGTTTLKETSRGVEFETVLGSRSYELDLVQSVERGDISQCSWAFINAVQPEWKEESDGQGKRILVRELVDFDIDDISVVTYPAYSGTHAGLEARARMFPAGLPVDLRARLNVSAPPAEEIRTAQLERARWRSRARGQAGEFRAETNSGVLEVIVYDVIGEDFWTGGGVTARRVKAAIDGATFSRIVVRINSDGGDGFEGTAIYNLLRSVGKPVTVYVDGLAASAAATIAMAGDAILMGAGSMLMIHDPWTIALGNATELEAVTNWLRQVEGSIAEVYVTRTGLPAAEIRAMMAAETWLSAADAIAKGFATGMQGREETPVSPAATSERHLRLYRNVPAAFDPAARYLARAKLGAVQARLASLP